MTEQCRARAAGKNVICTRTDCPWARRREESTGVKPKTLGEAWDLFVTSDEEFAKNFAGQLRNNCPPQP